MNNNDEYLVYIRNDGTRFYYKNKLLHREAGPAIAIPNEEHHYTNLSDEELYKKTTTPVISEGINWDFTVKHLDNGDFEIIKDPPVYFPYSCYYLDGKEYIKQEFNAILLKEALEKNKSQSEDTDSRKTKV